MMNAIEFHDSLTSPERPRRRWVGMACGAITIAVLAAGLWPIIAGKTDPPVFAKKSAEAELARARAVGAAHWSAGSLLAAEAAMKTAFTEYRIQEVKFICFRDFTTVRALLTDAESKSRVAGDEAARTRAAAKTGAQEAIDLAEVDAGMSSSFGDAMHLSPFERKLLQKSKIGLAEAKILFARGSYENAAARAREVSSSARRVTSEAAEAVERFGDSSLVRNWQRQVVTAIGASRQSGGPAIVVLKDNKRLDLYRGGKLVKSYRADMGYRSFNDKLRSGDAATPEGSYHITSKRGEGTTTYYKAFDLDYPNSADRAQFEKLRRSGRIPRTAKIGGSIQIHGEGGRGRDWTRGCVALSNRDMDDLFRRIGIGTPVTIVGGDGEGVYARLARQHATQNSGTQ